MHCLRRSSTTKARIDTAARFDEFLSWLLSKDITQLEMPGAGRTFRRRNRVSSGVSGPCRCPTASSTGPFVDGSARGTPGRADLLQRGSGGLMRPWRKSENSRAWSALMEPIPAPDVVVTDGGSGFAKAVRAAWPRPRCRDACSTYAQVKRCTTTRPKLQAGRELNQIALDLTHIRRCTRRSCARAISTGAASSRTSWRTSMFSSTERRIRTRGPEGREVARRWSPRGRCPPSSTPSSRRGPPYTPITRFRGSERPAMGRPSKP